MITLAARELSPQTRIVARASDERNARRMSKSGANATVCPDIAAGGKLASAMLRPHAHGFIDALSLGGNAVVVEAIIESKDSGTSIQHYVGQRKNHAAMALCRQSVWSVALDPHMALQDGDVLIMLSSPQHDEKTV